jgi:hypothetical protein
MGSGYSSVVVDDETFGEDGHFKVHIKLHKRMGEAERTKLREAAKLWVTVWQSRAFKDWVLSYRFEDTSLSNGEIYERLAGHAVGVGMVENLANIEIWTKKDRGRETYINTTFEHDGKKWEGSEYLFTYSAAKLAGFLAHEYCRHLDLLHVGCAERSVPFAVGKETKRIAEATKH